jgi:hypothetical protein
MAELTFAQRISQLKAKVSTTTWKHEQFLTGANAGAFVGVKESGKFYLLVSATNLKGGNNSTRKAILNIDPEATGLTPDMFQEQLSEADTKSMIESLFGVKAKIILIESLTPQWEGQEPSLDKNGNVLMKNGMPLFVQTQISDANAVDVLVNANNVSPTVLAEDTF